VAVLGNRGTGVLDMLIEGFRNQGQEVVTPINMSPVTQARTPLQQAMNRPEVMLSQPTGRNMVTFDNGRMIEASTTPDVQRAMSQAAQPMSIDQARASEGFNRIAQYQAPSAQPQTNVPVNRLIGGQQPAMGQGVMREGMDREQMMRDAKAAKDVLETGDESLIERAKSYFGSRENMLRLAMAFNTMRLEPDQALTAALSKQLENVGVNSRAQQVALALRQKGTPAALSAADYIERTGDYKGGYKMFRESGKVRQISGAELNLQSGTTAYDEEKMYNQNTITGQVTAVGGGGIDIELPSEQGSQKLFEQVGKGSGDMIIKQAEQLPQLQDQVANLQILDQLSEALATGATNIPDFLKGSVPEGMNSSIDAYRAIVFTVAQGLRQAGSGPMTDKDFDILVSRAGSISADVNARRIAQAALRRAANNALRRARIAEQFRLNPTEEGQQKYVVEIETLNQELEDGILTPTERTLLQKMGPQQQAPQYDTSNMDQATSTYFNSLSAPAQAYFMSQSSQKQQELVQSGQTR